jgi:hypothetical protein
LVFLVVAWLFSAMGTFAWGYPYLRVCPWGRMGWCFAERLDEPYGEAQEIPVLPFKKLTRNVRSPDLRTSDS